jgi:hypothetical protein
MLCGVYKQCFVVSTNNALWCLQCFVVSTNNALWCLQTMLCGVYKQCFVVSINNVLWCLQTMFCGVYKQSFVVSTNNVLWCLQTMFCGVYKQCFVVSTNLDFQSTMKKTIQWFLMCHFISIYFHLSESSFTCPGLWVKTATQIHTFCKGSPKAHSSQVSLQMVHWFQIRIILKCFTSSCHCYNYPYLSSC